MRYDLDRDPDTREAVWEVWSLQKRIRLGERKLVDPMGATTNPPWVW